MSGNFYSVWKNKSKIDFLLFKLKRSQLQYNNKINWLGNMRIKRTIIREFTLMLVKSNRANRTLFKANLSVRRIEIFMLKKKRSEEKIFF